MMFNLSARKDLWAFPAWGFTSEVGCEGLCMDFIVNMGFHLRGICVQESSCWVYLSNMYLV